MYEMHGRLGTSVHRPCFDLSICLQSVRLSPCLSITFCRSDWLANPIACASFLVAVDAQHYVAPCTERPPVAARVLAGVYSWAVPPLV
jgi:hypothetical protein